MTPWPHVLKPSSPPPARPLPQAVGWTSSSGSKSVDVEVALGATTKRTGWPPAPRPAPPGTGLERGEVWSIRRRPVQEFPPAGPTHFRWPLGVWVTWAFTSLQGEA